MAVPSTTAPILPKTAAPATAPVGTQAARSAARLMLSPAVILLLIWMIVPLALTLWFSFQRYNLLTPDRAGSSGSTTTSAS
jgi:ABC-type sugar transport system permease subunit